MVTQPKTSKQFTADIFEANSKRANQKIAEETDDLIRNKKSNGINKVSKTLQQNNSEKVTNQHDEEIPKEKFVYLGERQNIIDDLLR